MRRLSVSQSTGCGAGWHRPEASTEQRLIAGSYISAPVPGTDAAATGFSHLRLHFAGAGLKAASALSCGCTYAIPCSLSLHPALYRHPHPDQSTLKPSATRYRKLRQNCDIRLASSSPFHARRSQRPPSTVPTLLLTHKQQKPTRRSFQERQIVIPTGRSTIKMVLLPGHLKHGLFRA